MVASFEVVLRYDQEVCLHNQHSGLWVSVLFKSMQHAGT